MEEHERNLEHIFVAYRHCVQFVPDQQAFREGHSLKVGNTTFEKYSQAYSVLVELGWAFFTRMEAWLEALVHEKDIRVRKNRPLIKILEEDYKVTFTDNEKEGMKLYREIRNLLHHGDGNKEYYNRPFVHLDIADGSEPHLLPEHIRNFYELFKKIGKIISAS